jgi:hypothetical protein
MLKPRIWLTQPRVAVRSDQPWTCSIAFQTDHSPRALPDQFALELSNGGEQGGEQTALRATGVPKGIAKRTERGPGLADPVD